MEPADTGSGASVLVRDRSAAGLIVVVAVALLLELSESGWSPEIEAVLVSVPAVVGVTTIVTVAVVLTGRERTLHVTVPADSVQVPRVEDADTNVALAGRGSATVTLVSSIGPLFVAVSVYVRLCPTKTGSGESAFVMTRSVGGQDGCDPDEQLA